MKTFIQFILAQHPWLYKTVLRLKGSGRYNVDKLIFLSVVNRGDVVIDVGANRGYYTVLFSHLVGPTGKVHAFEPVPPTFATLKETVKSDARYNNVELNSLALSDQNGTDTIYLPGTDDGQSSLRTHTSGSWSDEAAVKSYEIKTNSLDTFAAEHNIERLNFIKIDTEGAELLVINGGANVIERHHPIVYAEIFNDWSQDFHYTSADLVARLMALGYRTFYLIGQDIRRVQDPIVELSAENLRSSVNLLCSVENQPEIDKLAKAR